MKKVLLGKLVLMASLALLLSACQDKPESSTGASSSSSSQLEVESSEETESSQETEEMMTVGTEAFGYVDIPADWISFTDLNFGETLQYTDPEAPSKSIITLYSYTAEQLGVTNLAEVSTEDMANSYALGVQDNPLLVDMRGGKTSIGGHEAYQLYAEMETGVVLVAWIFKASADKYYSVSMEGEPAAVEAMVPTIETTWRERKE